MKKGDYVYKGTHLGKRKGNIKIPIIVLTVSHNKRAEFLNEGFNEYMTKLLDQDKVLETLPKVLKKIEFTKQKL